MTLSRLVLAMTLLAGVAGCAGRLDDALSPNFGLAAASLQSQIVPPAAPSDQPPEGSGARGVAAIQRYEAGQPKIADTSSTSALKDDSGIGGGLSVSK